jgi:hypothetical protein
MWILPPGELKEAQEKMEEIRRVIAVLKMAHERKTHTVN